MLLKNSILKNVSAIFFKKLKILRGSHVLFNVNLTGFWTIDFSPVFEGGYMGLFSPIEEIA